MIVLFLIYMILWLGLFLISMDVIYDVLLEIRNELRKMNNAKTGSKA